MTAASLWMPLKKPVIHNRIRYQKSYQTACKGIGLTTVPVIKEEKDAWRTAPIPSHSRMHNCPWITEGKSKASEDMKNNTAINRIQEYFQQRHQQSTTVFAGCGKEKKILVRRSKRNLTSSSHNLNLECQIWSTSNVELSLQRLVGEIF